MSARGAAGQRAPRERGRRSLHLSDLVRTIVGFPFDAQLLAGDDPEGAAWDGSAPELTDDTRRWQLEAGCELSSHWGRTQSRGLNRIRRRAMAGHPVNVDAVEDGN